MIAVVIPCFNVKSFILDVIGTIGPEVNLIVVVDDCCPEKSGEHVKKFCTDPRVHVCSNVQNLGVGGAVKAGYLVAMELGARFIVKIDGDNQMDARMIPRFVEPLANSHADYCKGNRFYELEALGQMPKIRLVGNAGLSFLNKLVSGYWNIMDPTNGYTAIHVDVLRRLPLDKISNRYFFESDMLFRLNTYRAVVKDIEMAAKYGDELSNLRIPTIIRQFPTLFLNRFIKRIFYNYFLRDFNLGSIYLVLGVILFSFGTFFGVYSWILHVVILNQPAASGKIMAAALPIILGYQSIIFFFQHDIMTVPNERIRRDKF